MMIYERDAEHDILDQALQAVMRETGLRLDVKDVDVKIDNYQIDALVQIEGVKAMLAAEVKKWAPQANFGALIDQVKQLPEKGMLVADYVNPKMAERLRHEGVQFIDTAGNAFINMPPAYVYVTGNRIEAPKLMHIKDGAKRAFEPTGLKVIFAFLCDPKLVNAPYREIAEKAGVAVGTVGWVLNGLKAADFVRERGKKQGRRLVNYKKLLERWVEVYPEKLRPKQLIGEFMTDDPYWWKEIDIRIYNGYWGGEVAAEKYTNYLRPQVATVYLRDIALTRFLVDARLRKVTEWMGDKPGKVIIYKYFWPENNVEPDINTREDLVHPILAYADLLATGDARNIEVARRIYDEHIAQYFRED